MVILSVLSRTSGTRLASMSLRRGRMGSVYLPTRLVNTNSFMRNKYRRPLTHKSLAERVLKDVKGNAQNKIYYNNKSSDVRAVAEWEDMGGVLVACPPLPMYDLPEHYTNELNTPQSVLRGPQSFGIPEKLIVEMMQLDSDEPVHIFILTGTVGGKTRKIETQFEKPDSLYNNLVLSSVSNAAKENNLAFDSKYIHFVPWTSDSYWTRDFGPWWVQSRTNSDHFSIMKHIYTTMGGGVVGIVENADDDKDNFAGGIFRPNDDYGAVFFHDYLTYPMTTYNKKNKFSKDKLIDVPGWYFSGLLEVSGNYMTNGDNIIASSYLVANQNNLATNDTLENRMNYVLSEFNRFAGAKEYYGLVDPSGTYIGHIDCWGKFLGTNKILINDDNKYDDIAKLFLDNKFEVYRIHCPYIKELHESGHNKSDSYAAYTNSLLLNNRVYLPVPDYYNGKYDVDNKNAQNVYLKALGNNWEVIQVSGRSEYSMQWLATDALHCRTHGIPRTVVNNWLKAVNGL